MDREISALDRRKKIIKRSISASLAICLGATVLFWGSSLLRPTVKRDRIRTATVDVGIIEATIQASGIVIPEVEQVISSPINTRVLKVLRQPGDLLQKGDPVLELDTSDLELSLKKLDQQIALKKNQQDQERLNLENALIKLKSQREIKSLEYQSAKSNARQQQELHDYGLVSKVILEQAVLQEEKARLDLKQLEEEKANVEKSTHAKLEGLKLEIDILEKERNDLKHQLALATGSDREGVLTWIIEEEGSTVQSGDILARVADLNSFRVKATLSDIHAGRLATGLPARVKIEDRDLEGSVINILPTIENGIITLIIGLEERSSALLKSNLRVDVLILTHHKEKALRLKRGPAINTEGYHEVFVIRGDRALKTPVRAGICGFDRLEIVEGLMEGDEVIISEMKDYAHLNKVRVK